MKRYFCLMIVLLLSFTLCGCDSWMDGNYTSVTPHTVDDSRQPRETVEVTNYTQLQSALWDLVEDCGSNSIFYTSFVYQNAEEMMADAISGVMTNSPIAAYAVEKIDYDIGTNSGRNAIAIKVTYRYDRTELLRIKQVSQMDEAVTLVTSALVACDPGVVIKVDNYQETDLAQVVQDYVDAHPDTCMELPQVSATAYPDLGNERIIAVNFTYKTSREVLRQMQQTVAQVFSSAELYVSTDAEVWEKYEQLYAFLMERYNYTIQTSITPSYSLLRHGVGDSKAFATVYAAMCRQVGLDCTVISGTRYGESRYWNLLSVDDVRYHVDLLQCSRNGVFQANLDNQMYGYVWDYSAYTEPDQPDA